MVNTINIILLAAGNSTRMGLENKLLLPYQGKPLVRHVVETLHELHPHQIVLVTGHESDLVVSQTSCIDNIVVRHNPNFLHGQTSSIITGLQAIPESMPFMICLADMPFLSVEHYKKLLNFAELANAGICRPFVDDILGHPVIFKSKYRSSMLQCPHQDGCRSVIQEHIKDLVRYKTQDTAYIRDIDTVDDKKQLLN